MATMEAWSPLVCTRFQLEPPKCVDAFWFVDVFGHRRVIVIYDQPIQDPMMRDLGDAYRVTFGANFWVVTNLSLAGDSALMLFVEQDGASDEPGTDHVRYTADPQVVVSLETGLPALPHDQPLRYAPP